MIKKINKEKLFFISYILFLIGILINETKYNFIPVALKVSHVIQLLGCFLAIIKILLDLYEMYNTKKKIVINYKWLLFYIISFIVIIVTRSKVIAYLPIFVLASKDIKIDKILKYTLYTYLFMLVFTLISYLSGIIVEISLERGGRIRHSFGWTSANQLMIIIFEIIALYLYLRKDKLKIYDFIGCLLLLAICYYFTNSRMSIICSIILLGLFMLVKYTKINKLLDKTKYLVYSLPVVCSIVIIGLTILFNYIDLSKLDDFLTARLYFGNEAIKEYKIKPFGSEIKYYGQRAEGELSDKSYNYIDSSYLKSLVNYGCFYYIITLILVIVLIKYAYKNKNYYLLIILISITLYVTIDSFLLSIELNPWLLYLMGSIYPIEITSKKRKNMI